MADVAPKAPGTRRGTHKSGEAPSPGDERRHTEDGAETGADTSPMRGPAFIAERAAVLVARLSGRRPESVISIDRKGGEWCVGVEVVEVSRIPDSADVLAVYDVRLDADGELISYHRVRRYARGQLDCERQR
jgi:Gas vesicle synthesis protein GvpO